MKANAYKCLLKIQKAIEENHLNMRDEPESDGDTHDQWEDEDNALSELEDAIDSAVSAFDDAGTVRRSLLRMSINLSE